MPNRNNSFWYDLLPPLVRGICQIEKYSISFFSNEGSFLHLFDSLDSRIELNFIELCLAIQITFVLKKIRIVASQMTEIRSITSLFITCDQVIGLPNHVIR